MKTYTPLNPLSRGELKSQQFQQLKSPLRFGDLGVCGASQENLQQVKIYNCEHAKAI